MNSRIRIGCALALALILSVVAAGPSTAEANGTCAEVRVESRDRLIVLSTYTVADPEYVARMQALIDERGHNGSLVVPAGDLGTLGYTVTYTCLGAMGIPAVS